MLNNRYIALIGLIILSVGCKSSEVMVLEDDNKNFRLGNYGTFGFFETVTEGDFTQNEQISIGLIKEEIISQFNQRGLILSNENPELKVNIGIRVEEKTQTRETGLVTDPGTFNYIGQRRYTWKSETVETGKFRQGTGTLHLVDTKSQKAVWVGYIEKIIPSKSEKIGSAIKEGVQKLFITLDEYN